MVDEFATLDEATLKVNLSYVLHEPSTSRAVHRSWRTSKRFLRQKKHVLQWFRTLSDRDFAGSILVSPELTEALNALEGPAHNLTASVGLPELLGRAIEVTRASATSNQTGPGTLVDSAVSPGGTTYVQFFRAPGELANPGLAADTRSVVVAGLLLRPDERSLLLTGNVVNLRTDLRDRDSPLSSSMIATLERVIRDYIDQWTPQRRIWQKPAEIGLPELGARDRST